MNKIFLSRAKLSDLLKVSSSRNFHSFFFKNAIKMFFDSQKKYGTVLVLGSSHIDAEELIKYPFKKIVLSGILQPDEKLKAVIKKDKRVSYRIENMENISFEDDSFDLVFTKESLHHVSRPIVALYEMLRVSRKAVIFIEPQETLVGSLLEKLSLTSKYERDTLVNEGLRDNYVYRWRKKEVIKILNSYFLESGYKVYFLSCWMSNRLNIKFKYMIKIFNFLGWIASFVPLNKGNYLICMIIRGKDKPHGYFQ